jgi:hypothetical protein
MDADLERARRLESIFMPEANRQREKLLKRQIDEWSEPSSLRFAHYTSADAAMKILRSKRIWMRNTNSMTDYREVAHGYDILRNFFSDQAKVAELIAAVDACSPGAAKNAIDNFDGWLKSYLLLNIFVSSISEHRQREDRHGRLSMWRAFGGQKTRVALIIKVPWFTGAAEELGVIFSPVAYLTELEVHTVIGEVIANVQRDKDFLKTISAATIQGYVFSMLLTGITCLKHEGFDEEREWRAIYAPQISSSPLMQKRIEVVSGVPQQIYELPLDEKLSQKIAGLDLFAMLDRIIIGPSQYP